MMTDVEVLNYCESQAKNNARIHEAEGQKHRVITLTGGTLTRLYKVAEVEMPGTFVKDEKIDVDANIVAGLVTQGWEALRRNEQRFVKKNHVYNQAPR